MEEKYFTWSDPAFDLAAEEFGTFIFLITDFDFIVDGKHITHISLNENMEACAIASTEQPDYEFWEYDFEQIPLTKKQWEEIVTLIEDL